MEWFFRNIIDHYKGWLGWVLALVLLGGWSIVTKMESDNSIDIWFLEDDPHYQEYLEFQKTQGSDEIVMALIPSSTDVFDTSFVRRLYQAQLQLEQLPYVHSGLSLATIQEPRLIGSKIVLKPVFSPGISPQRLARKLKELPSGAGHLMDSTHHYAALYLQLRPTKALKPYRHHIVADVRGVLDRYFKDYKLSGFPVINEAINQIVLREAFTFSLLAIIIILFVLLVFLPDLRYLLLALSSVIVPVLVTFGIYAYLGFQMNSMTIIVPTILMVYSLSDTIHILNTFHLTKADTIKSRILEAFKASFTPCLFTTLTTMVGYLALYLTVMPALKMLGVFSALGLSIAFVSAYVVTGIGLMILGEKRWTGDFRKAAKIHLDVDVILHWINNVTERYSPALLVMFAGIFVFGVWAVPHVIIDNDSRNLLAEGKYKKDLEFIEETMGGGIMFFINFVSTDDKRIIKPNKLKGLRAFESGVQQAGILQYPVSVVDVKDYILRSSGVQLMMAGNVNRSLASFDTDKNDTPIFNMMSRDKLRTTMISKVRMMSSNDYVDLHHKMDSIYRKSGLMAAGVKMEVKGYSPLYVKMVDYIYTSQLRSFLGAFFIAFLILFYFVRSVRIAILALIPNLFPILMLAIIMYVLGVNLEAGNSIIAPIMLGIAMDDTIHLLFHYQRFRQVEINPKAAMNRAMLFTGKAVITTSLSLVMGFMIIVMSRVETLREFGLLCSSAVLFALLADLFLLPALVKRFGK